MSCCCCVVVVVVVARNILIRSIDMNECVRFTSVAQRLFGRVRRRLEDPSAADSHASSKNLRFVFERETEKRREIVVYHFGD